MDIFNLNFKADTANEWFLLIKEEEGKGEKGKKNLKSGILVDAVDCWEDAIYLKKLQQRTVNS